MPFGYEHIKAVIRGPGEVDHRTLRQRERAARGWAAFGLLFGVAWIWGLGSIVAIVAGGLARSSTSTSSIRRLGTAAIVVGGAGLLAALALGVRSLT